VPKTTPITQSNVVAVTAAPFSDAIAFTVPKVTIMAVVSSR
jgi:hypothetical protein